MSVRVVARIRPLLPAEISRDIIVTAAPETEARKTTVRIPSPKNESEAYSFQFNSVYDPAATQAQIFDQEISPTVKHLFKGYDVTLFAYGVTGTGKTHTMRGGKSLADRGVIPRLLSAIYRKARRAEKDGEGETRVEVSMSYYEIYNDKVFDLFEPPEKRTPAGLPIRDVGNGKTQVVGLTERPCTTLKEFEGLYDQANVNRSTSATKLNAHSSRSHAILCVRVTQTSGEQTRVSTASAIDLAGSEDNRRTDNNGTRMVESASINKSLFVLAQCVEAISKKQARIPYRESKMTRILSLGQNNGFTVMILNLAPVRSYHLDTLSSLNFANRTKKIEVNEVENQPFFREQPGKPGKGTLGGEKANGLAAPVLHRQPLRPKLLSQDSHLRDLGTTTAAAAAPKPVKKFAVYADKPKAAARPPNLANTGHARTAATSLVKSPKRTSSEAIPTLGRPSKISRHHPSRSPNPAAAAGMSADAIEALIERKVSEALAEHATNTTNISAAGGGEAVSDEVQRRLDALEKRVQGQENERAEGLQYLLMAKQHQVRGENASALKMYELALPHFPGNEKLVGKMSALRWKIEAKRMEKEAAAQGGVRWPAAAGERAAAAPRKKAVGDEDASYHEPATTPPAHADEAAAESLHRPRTKLRHQAHPRPPPAARSATAPLLAAPAPAPASDSRESSEDDELSAALTEQTPRTRHLLHIINTRDVAQIQLLKGVGARKAEAIVNCLCDVDDEGAHGDEARQVRSLGELGGLRGVGVKTVENMRVGLSGLVM